MALPKYDKSKRTKTYESLPKGAYVVKIMNAVEEANRNGKGSHLTISFDIAEGDYKDIYANQYLSNTAEDKKWPRDAVYYLTVPDKDSKDFVWQNWNNFFADLEDSNNGFVFGGDVKTLKGKLIGGKFHIEQNEWNGNVYDHTRLRWTCVAEDVRTGSAGKLPPDKLVTSSSGASYGSSGPLANAPENEWMNIPDNIEDELPF